MKRHTLLGTIMTLSAIFTLGLSSQVFGNVVGNINDNGVNVRLEANTASEKVATVDEGTEVQLVAEEEDWYKVIYNDTQEAYVFKDYVDVVQATGDVTGTEVNIRNSASTSGEIVAKVNAGDTVTVIGKSGGWYQIRRINGEMAYVSSQFIDGMLVEDVPSFNETEASIVTTYGIVTAETGLNLREEAASEGAVIELLAYNQVVDVIEVGNEWVKVETELDQVGFVSVDYLAVRSGEKPSRSVSSKGTQVVEYAKQFLGTPYVWAGTNLNSGVDCSGFVYSVMKEFGVSLNRSSAAMASNGVFVERSQLQPGDLIFFDTTNSTNQGYISHVGIYIGNNEIVHAASGSAMKVIISSLSENYYNTKYVTARRVLR